MLNNAKTLRIKESIKTLAEKVNLRCMKVNKKEEALLKKAIEHWKQETLIDEATEERLKKSVSSYKYEYDALSVYAFVAAISCGILAFGALVLDEKWLERMRNFFEVSQFIIGFVFTGLSAFLFWVSKRRVKKYPAALLANESFNIQLVLSIGVAATYFGKGFGATFEWYGLLILLVGIAYAICAQYLQSKLMWLCMMIALVVAWGVQTWAWSDDAAHNYYLGMNYPLRMAVLGLLMVAAAWGLKQIHPFNFFHNITWHFSWIFFLFSALALSISGNLHYELWAAIKQGRLIGWAIGYTLLLVVLIVYAFRSKDDLLRDVFVIFFLANLYVRFFEYFWNRTNKGIFFAILALSFWLIGRHAEKIRQRLNN